jgi:WhiB family redox-sensing transcriptional regulator
VKQLQAFEARVVRLEATVATLTASKELLPPVDDDTLPGPTLAVIALPDWVDEALCAQTDPEAFHPTKGRPGREAKAVCGRCPVKADCLDHALAHHEESGIWGGMSPRERRKLAAHNGSPT